MFKLKSIGSIESDNQKTVVTVDKDYRRALKYLDKFSHIHVFYLSDDNGKDKVHKVILQIQQVNAKNGTIIFDTGISLQSVDKLIDVKPYFPCEDCVRIMPDMKKQKEYYMEVKKNEDGRSYEVDSAGLIRNVNGERYIELNQPCDVKGSYLKVYWWFDKFDEDKYRRIQECDPPYEDAPRTGVFATRSPVRPNPIAMTVVKVLRVDREKNRIYINGIESFDKTPCLGVDCYVKEDRVTACKVPEWLEHWPKWFDDTEQNDSAKPVELIDSGLEQLLRERKEKDYSLPVEKEHIPVMPDINKEIAVYGARENNLKGINVKIPYGKITAVVGVSGSGKSSLVNDTIYAECRRRMKYLNDSRNMLQKPNVENMTGCIPAVVISQDAIHGNTYSTVGTYTNAYDYLRILYASISVRHCPNCGHEIIPLSREDIMSFLDEQKKVTIYDLSKQKVIGVTITDRVDVALKKGKGAFYVTIADGDYILLQTKQKCYHCDTLLFEMTPATFSYMDTESRCAVCHGTGKTIDIDETKLVIHPERSLLDGAISFYGKLKIFQESPNANWMKGQVFGLAKKMQVDLTMPWCELPASFREKLLHGSDEEVTFSYNNKKNGRKGEITRPVEGICQIIKRMYMENSDSGAMNQFMKKVTCQACQGERLNKEGRMATIEHISYPKVAEMTFEEAATFCDSLQDQLDDRRIAKVDYTLQSLREIAAAAIQLGVGHLHLNQEISTLSGGEGQRIKLLGAAMKHITGILYIFDEPSKGLHPRDYEKVIHLIRSLRDEGNTIMIVEHNEDMIRIADNIIEIGPGAGEKGGMLVGEGTLDAMLHHKGTQISRYMNSDIEKRSVIEELSIHSMKFIYMKNLNYQNLKNIEVQFPKKALTCICGVSGSGKSSLMKGEIYKQADKGKEFSEVILVDQLPVGKTSKSIVATYIGIMDTIRTVFAGTKEAIQNDWDEAYFSFNGTQGQCPNCKGNGKIKLPYMEDAYMLCPDCKGKRYQKKILKIEYQEKNIDDILRMSIEEAIEFFNEYEVLVHRLQSLERVGLGYLKLGQGTSTLSGGEASRLKMAKELITKKSGKKLYLLDEPTTGLHFSDIEQMLKLIDELISAGNTVVAIEHNKQFIRHCNWMIELGPGAGENGGRVLRQSEKMNFYRLKMNF